VNAILTLVIAGVGLGVGYFYYAKNINKNVFQPDDQKATPAKMYMDGVDFTPAGKNVLFGYQFKSIAALGPIGGPIVAAQWGWLPGLLWIIFGTFFIGWVQDYASIIVAQDAPDFVLNRIAMQDGYMEEIWRSFPDVRATVPLFETEVRGVEMLRRTASHLFA